MDSRTASRTSCAASHSLTSRSSAAPAPHLRRSNWNSPGAAASAITTASIFVCPSIPATLYASILPLSGSAWGAWRDNFKHPFALRLDSVTGLGRAHSFLQSQAPDHTASRPQPIHCRLDLDRAIHLIGCSTDSGPVFIPVPGPQAPGDSLEKLTLRPRRVIFSS